MDLHNLKELWLTVPVNLDDETIRVTLNAARFNSTYYTRMADTEAPLSVDQALEYLCISWDLTAEGTALAPVTAENLAGWKETWPVLWTVVDAVFDTILTACDPKVRTARASRGRTSTPAPTATTLAATSSPMATTAP